jgi:hypothetical protein
MDILVWAGEAEEYNDPCAGLINPLESLALEIDPSALNL